MTEPLLLPSGAHVQVRPPGIPIVRAAPSSPTNLIVVPVPGARGQPGLGVIPIYNEVPVGAINGINTSFTTLSPFEPGSTCVYVQGDRQQLGIDYSEVAPNTLLFAVAPPDDLWVDYLISDLEDALFVEKDPGSTLDYLLDWSAWLNALPASGDTIATSSFSCVDSDLTLGTNTHTATTTTIWLSGGGAVGEVHPVVNHITTVGLRTQNFTLNVLMKEN